MRKDQHGFGNKARLALNVRIGESKVLKNNTAVSTTTILLDGGALEEVMCFICPRSIFDKQKERREVGGGGGGGMEAGHATLM